MSNFNFYNANKVYGELYFQLPVVLFYSDTYAKLSDSAKIAYSLFRDRLQYSIKNNWVDKDQNVYFVFTNEELCTLLKKSENTVTKIKQELEKANLLLQKKQGYDRITKKNKPNRLYIADLEVNATDIYQLQKREEILIGQGTAETTVPEKPLQTQSNQGTAKTTVPENNKEKPLETLINQGTAENDVYLYDSKSIKDLKESKESYADQIYIFEKAISENNNNQEIETLLIENYIEEENIIEHYGELLVRNFKQYSFGSFATFKLFYEKVYFAHRSVEKENDFTFMLDPAFTINANSFKKELSKTFWRVIQLHRNGKVKKDLNNLLFISFKNDFQTFYENINYEKNNTDKPKVPLINYTNNNAD